MDTYVGKAKAAMLLANESGKRAEEGAEGAGRWCVCGGGSFVFLFVCVFL